MAVRTEREVMHMYQNVGNYHGGNGIVGAQCAVGAGVAFGLKYRQTPNICLTFYGDGAANQGQLFEAINMAALWKLPVLFICENNHYGMGTSDERASASIDYYTRGDYIPGLKIDAMNVFAVREGVKYAAAYARKSGPMVLEMETYRYMGHSMSDPGLTYRSRDEVSIVREKRDPIEYVKTVLLDHKLSTEEELKELDKEAKAIVEAGLAEAKACPFPEAKELYTDVQTDRPYFVRAVELSKSVIMP